MSLQTHPTDQRDAAVVVYPDSDGQPMADNTLQFQWITTIKDNIEAIFGDNPDVFVAGDLLWYPVEGDPATRTAPDALVVFGRPKGHRGSYKQWEEEGIAPHVVFEVLSPGNRAGEMLRKQQFYERFGVEEYYIYDPDNGTLVGFLRQGDRFQSIPEMRGWRSPRLGVVFDLAGSDLRMTGPDGRPFATFMEVMRLRAEAEHRAEADRARAEAEHQRAEAEHQRAEAEHAKAERLRAQLRALGIEPEE